MTVLKIIGLIVLLIVAFWMWAMGGLKIWSHSIIGIIAYAIYCGSIILNSPTWYKIGICIVTIIGTLLYLLKFENLIISKIEEIAFGTISSRYGKFVGGAARIMYNTGKIFLPSSITETVVGYGKDYVIDNYIGRIKYRLICILVFVLYIFLLALPFIIS